MRRGSRKREKGKGKGASQKTEAQRKEKTEWRRRGGKGLKKSWQGSVEELMAEMTRAEARMQLTEKTTKRLYFPLFSVEP